MNENNKNTNAQGTAQRLLDVLSETYIAAPSAEHSPLPYLIAALGGGAHVLVQGPPGTAKTLVARALAAVVGVDFARIQMTPDMMPGDILGANIWLPNEGRFSFRPGPLFHGVLLADELNRAPPKTQAALLEAMQEGQATIDGESHPLPPGFWVLATQNPIEQEGTYPLPESQLDRFALCVPMGHAEEAAEIDILKRIRDHRLQLPAAAVLAAGELQTWRQQVAAIRVEDGVLHYISEIVRTTRGHHDLQWGAGVRAAIALMQVGRGLAAVRQRAYVIPDDIQELANMVLGHRLRLTPEAYLAGISLAELVNHIVKNVPMPAVAG